MGREHSNSSGNEKRKSRFVPALVAGGILTLAGTLARYVFALLDRKLPAGELWPVCVFMLFCLAVLVIVIVGHRRN